MYLVAVMIESKSGKTRISAPAHLSATGGRVSGLVLFHYPLIIVHFVHNQLNKFLNGIVDPCKPVWTGESCGRLSAMAILQRFLLAVLY